MQRPKALGTLDWMALKRLDLRMCLQTSQQHCAGPTTGLFGQDDGKSDNKENYRVGPPMVDVTAQKVCDSTNMMHRVPHVL
jgi:hypothetical protein